MLTHPPTHRVHISRWAAADHSRLTLYVWKAKPGISHLQCNRRISIPGHQSRLRSLEPILMSFAQDGMSPHRATSSRRSRSSSWCFSVMMGRPGSAPRSSSAAAGSLLAPWPHISSGGPQRPCSSHSVGTYDRFCRIAARSRASCFGVVPCRCTLASTHSRIQRNLNDVVNGVLRVV